MSYSCKKIKEMLPKTYLRKHVASDIYIALTYFKNLEPVMDKYVYNDGTTNYLMSLTGTIPVVYETYDVPLCLWIEESYPHTAPICYVRHTKETEVLTGKFLSSNGEVMLPYLAEWKSGECDLVSLLQVMVAMFEDFPPICMQSHSKSEQASFWLQINRRKDVPSNRDEHFCLPLAREDGQPFQFENETNC
ncbi:tumor susceptibility gene 101 protein [Antennarius striatus]|uniref:tumor susceptibility gene 101 protein n=1 Tax=Antennarius striatus TaxID=241820 RepID=UPI0035B15193